MGDQQAYYFDGFAAMVIEGVQRIDKTASASKAFAQAFGGMEVASSQLDTYLHLS